MKKLLLSLIVSIPICSTAYSQSSGDTFNTSQLTWFGIDYSHCYFITPADFPNTGDLKAKLKNWNELILYEREKYIEKTLVGKDVEYYTDAVKAQNDKVDIKSRLMNIATKGELLNTDQIESIINGYSIEKGMEGTGLVLIAERYDKPEEKGIYYVVFFDIASKSIFATEQMESKASGFGLRKYWANTFYRVLQEVGKKY